jgi:hypothetical protein
VELVALRGVLSSSFTLRGYVVERVGELVVLREAGRRVDRVPVLFAISTSGAADVDRVGLRASLVLRGARLDESRMLISIARGDPTRFARQFFLRHVVLAHVLRRRRVAFPADAARRAER